MGFTAQQTLTRQTRILERHAAELAAREAKEAADRARTELEARLSEEYPQLRAYDAIQLWGIATRLTDKLVAQYEAGEDKLEVSSKEWESLFEEVSLGSSLRRWTYTNNGNDQLLQPMARSYNDIGQVFEVRTDTSHATYCGRGLTDRQVIVVCRAPVPED